MAEMGRPTKLTKENASRICSAIAAGNYVETAAAYAGISPNTLREWLRRGGKERLRIEAGWPAKRSETKYREFSIAVEKAQAQGEVSDVAVIGMAAASGQWQAAAWRLERKYPEKYGRRDRMEIAAAARGELEDGKTEHYDLSKIKDPEKLRLLLEILAEAGDVPASVAVDDSHQLEAAAEDVEDAEYEVVEPDA